MDPLADQVRSELSRFGPQAGMAELLERWPDAVGAAIARNAWPARIARDGTVHVNTDDSVWAFELGQQAPEIAARSRAAQGPLRSRARCQSPIWSPGRPRSGVAGGRRARRGARLGDRRRKAARKCAKSGQFRPRARPRQPSDLIHFECLAKPAFCRHFLRMAKTKAKAGYSAKDITVLEGLEPVRLRPGMYIGSTGIGGLHHLVEEVVANSVDEALAGRNDSIEVTIHPDNSVTVRRPRRGHPGRRDGGHRHVRARGGAHEAARRRQVRRRRLQGLRWPPRRRRVGRERALGVAHREVERDGKIYRQEFARGEPQGPMTVVVGRRRTPVRRSRSSPTPTIFDETEFDATTLISRFREMAFLTKGLRIKFTDERADGGARSSSTTRAASRTTSATSTSRRTSRTGTSSTSSRRPTTARSRSRCSGTPPTRSRSSRSPTTSTRTRAARTCPASAPRSRRRSTTTRATKALLKEKEDNLEGEDVREGLAAVISVKLADPQFEGQTKTKLGNPWVSGLVRAAVNQKLAEFFEENPTDARADHQQGDLRCRAPARPRARRAS